MRPPVVKRQTTPMSGFLLFSAFFLAPSSRGHVSGLDCRMLVAQKRGCPKHVLRFSHRVSHDGRGPEAGALRPRHFSVPADRPRQTPGSTGNRCPVRCRLGGGAAPVHPGPLSPEEEEPEEVSQQTDGAGRGTETLRGVQRRRHGCLRERGTEQGQPMVVE